MKSKGKTYDLVYVAVFSVLTAICSWISIPAFVPFTLQTFAVFFTVGMLGGKRGTIAVLIYILLGAAGIPVFAGFTGGLGILLGTTGGYLIGFVFCALVMWAMEAVPGKRAWVLPLSMFLGMIVYMTFGTIWFMAVYSKTTGPVGLAAVLGWCVFPFIIPDLLKMGLAWTLCKRFKGLLLQ